MIPAASQSRSEQGIRPGHEGIGTTHEGIGTTHEGIGLVTCLSLVTATMVGTGVYTSLGFQLLDLKCGFSILVLWAVGGLISLCGALSYAELAGRIPRSGGEYTYLSEVYHPALGLWLRESRSSRDFPLQSPSRPSPLEPTYMQRFRSCRKGPLPFLW